MIGTEDNSFDRSYVKKKLEHGLSRIWQVCFLIYLFFPKYLSPGQCTSLPLVVITVKFILILKNSLQGYFFQVISFELNIWKPRKHNFRDSGSTWLLWLQTQSRSQNIVTWLSAWLHFSQPVSCPTIYFLPMCFFSVSTVILLYVSVITIAVESLTSCEPAWFHSIPDLTAGSVWCAVRPQVYGDKAVKFYLAELSFGGLFVCLFF